MKSLGKTYDCTLKDSIRATNQEWEGWLAAGEKSGLPGKYKAWIDQHGILPRTVWPYAGIWIHTVSCGWGVSSWKTQNPQWPLVLSLMMCPSASDKPLFANDEPSSFRLFTIWGLLGIWQGTWPTCRQQDKQTVLRFNSHFTLDSVTSNPYCCIDADCIAALTHFTNHLNTLVSDEKKKVTGTLVQTNSVQTNSNMTHYHAYSYMKPITNVAVTT